MTDRWPPAANAADPSRGPRCIDRSQGPRYIDRYQLQAALPLKRAMDALSAGFRSRAADEMDWVPRSVLTVPGRPADDAGELLLMPAHGPEGVGIKLLSIAAGNAARGLPRIQGLYVLMGRDGLTPELMIDGAALTELRTASVSALATRYMARPDSRRLVVFGAGSQAAGHVRAMRSILPIEHVTVVGSSSTSPRASSLVAQLLADGIHAEVGDAGAVQSADVICTCTTSVEPLFDPRDVRAGTHINAVGAYRLDMCELPAQTLADAALVVESVPATLAEAGDVVRAIESGALPKTGFARELREVLDGTATASDTGQVTVFKSVGLAAEDLIVARAAADALFASA